MSPPPIAPGLASASAYSLLGWLAARLPQPLALVVLARLLAPDDFGVFALGAAVVGFLGLAQDLGIEGALVQRGERREDVERSAFTLAMLAALALTLGAALLAPRVASFFGEPRVVSLLRLQGTVFLIQSLSVVARARLRMTLRFRELAVAGACAASVGALASLLGAGLGAGANALALGGLAGAAADSALAIRYSGHRPSFTRRLGAARGLAGFGGALLAQSFFVWALNTVDDVLVGRWLGASALGTYRVGFNVGTFVAVSFAGAVHRVSVSAFSRLRDQPSALARVYLDTLRYVALVSFPAAAALIVAPGPIVACLLGARWHEAAPVVCFTAVYGLQASVGGLTPHVANALGRPGIPLLTHGVTALVSVAVYALVVPRGIVWLALAHMALALARSPLDLWISRRLLGYRWREALSALAPGVACGAWSAVAFGSLQFLDGRPSLAALAVATAASVLGAAAIAVTVDRRIPGELRGVLSR